jgi:CTP synthase (UTP-ammonia lyase)
MTRIGLIGDYDSSITAHQAIPVALRAAFDAVPVPMTFEWVPTQEILGEARIAGLDAFWCVPASPYRSMDGALRAIRHAREHRRPFLGTCGGFQHAVVEYARNVLGWADAEHAETSPQAARAVISPLQCALVEKSGTIRLQPGSRLALAYGRSEIVEEYRCRFGINEEFAGHLTSGPLRAVGIDALGEVRAVELEGHPFFVATLFQPERAALKGMLPPLVSAFVRACALEAAMPGSRSRRP